MNNDQTSLPIIDSTAATLTHIRHVNKFLLEFCTELLKRAAVHDESKLHEPEKSVFDKYTPLLYTTVYNSDEYKAILQEMQVAIKHHEQSNSHHPGYYARGIDDMDLFDVVEMFCDWRAASLRIPDGSLWKSLPINKERFAVSNQLHLIFSNTCNNINAPDLDF